MSRQTTNGIDYTNKDYLAFKDMMISKLKERMPEYTDTSESDAGIVILEALANGLDIISYYADAVANDVVLTTTQDRRMALLLARNLGYTPYNQTASVIPMVFLLESAQEQDVAIPKGTVVMTEEKDNSEPVMFETVAQLIIPAGCLGDEKDEEGNYLYTVNARQGETVESDYFGSSNGTPYQTFPLTYEGVDITTLRLFVDEGEGEKEWIRVTSFQDSDANSRHFISYMDEYDICYIEFGNNINGKIPVSFDNGLRASYSVGGGTKGNVKENTITIIDSALSVGASCFNLAPVVLGHEKETLEEIKYNAPANNRVRDRAVTLKDYEDLLRINILKHDLFFGINNTKARRNLDNKLHVDWYYQMKPGYEMTEELESTINEFLEPRTMIGTSFTLIPFEEYKVDILASLYVKDDYNRFQVRDAVVEFLIDYFSPGKLTFGDEVIKSNLESEVINSIDGIKSFRINSPEEDIISCLRSYQIISIQEENISVNAVGGLIK